LDTKLAQWLASVCPLVFNLHTKQQKTVVFFLPHVKEAHLENGKGSPLQTSYSLEYKYTLTIPKIFTHHVSRRATLIEEQET
jgi:hypothetical protein